MRSNTCTDHDQTFRVRWLHGFGGFGGFGIRGSVAWIADTAFFDDGPFALWNESFPWTIRSNMKPFHA